MENARWASSVQLTVAEDVSFGSSREPSGFGPVCGKLSSDEAIKERDSPVRVLVGLGRLRVDFHDLELDRRSLGDRGGLEPCGGLDQWALSRHQFIRGLFEFTRDVVEFETIELVFKATYQLTVRLHLGVMAV